MDISFSFIESLLIAVLYFWTWTDFGLFPFQMLVWQEPVVIGFILGLAYGDPTTGLIMGGSIALIYFSNAPIGANLPSDSALAACVSIPIALKFDLPVETAVTMSIPFAVLGAMLDNLRRLLAGIWNRSAQRHIDKMEFNKLWIDGVAGPLAVSALLRIVPLTLLLYFAGATAGELLNSLPIWLSHAFTVIGGLLPGVGLVLVVTFIGRKDLLPYFIIAYFVAMLTGWGTLTLGIVFGAIAVLHVQLSSKGDEEDVESVDTKKLEPGMLSKKDINAFFLRYSMFQRVSQSIEYFYGTGICYSMYPSLKKIYKDDKEGLQKALKRHLEPFITNPNWGACLLSGSLQLEEKIAKSTDPTEKESIGEAITSLKTGMMGPFAGFGDIIDGLTTWPILKSIFYPFAVAGSPIGLLTTPILTILWNIEQYISTKLGYTAGRAALVQMVGGGQIKKWLLGAGVLGTSMIGALCASYVSLTTPVTIAGVSLQDNLNMILPGLLPAIFLGIVYYALSKNAKFINIILAIVAFSLVGSLIGIV